MKPSGPPFGTRCHLRASPPAGAAISRRFLIVIPNEEPRGAATRYRGQSSLMRHDQ